MKCFTTLDPSVGYGALLCPVFHRCSQMMSCVPSCESPQCLLSLLVLGGAVTLGQLHLRSPCSSDFSPLRTWVLVGRLEGHPVQKGTSGSFGFPGPHSFKVLYFQPCWNLLGKLLPASGDDGWDPAVLSSAWSLPALLRVVRTSTRTAQVQSSDCPWAGPALPSAVNPPEAWRAAFSQQTPRTSQSE